VLLLAVGAWWVYKSKFAAPTTAAPSTYIQVVAAKQGSIVNSITAVGELEAEQQEVLTFSRMSGTAKLLQLDVRTGNTVKAGQVLAAIDPTPYQQVVDQARSDLQASEQKLADLKTPASAEDIAKADVAITKAELAVQQAANSLADLKAPDLDSLRRSVADARDAVTLAELQATLAQHDATAKTERDLQYTVGWRERRIADLEGLIATGQANLEQTNALTTERDALAQAQADLARVSATRQLSLQAAAAAVAKAQATLADAEEALATALAGGDKLALGKAQLTVQEAEVSVAAARSARADLLVGPDTATLTAAQADVDKKRLALAEAEAALAGAKLTAPFDGTVLRVPVTLASSVAANTQIATIANMKTLQVVASVDETTIRRVKAGQTATVTFDALPGQTLRGRVTEAPLQGALQGNVMIYEVPISLTGAEALPLLVGMTANVQIQTAQAANAVLVPSVAVKQNGATYQVTLANGDDTSAGGQDVDVEIGLSDGTNTQIVRGLNVGEKVLVQYTARQTNSNTQSSGILSLFGSSNFLRNLQGR
jgi:RND family efflux transporter MFP subunit